MSELIRMDRQYQTRDGRAVRVLCVDLHTSGYPVAAAVTLSGGAEAVCTYTAEGRYGSSRVNDLDLIPLRVKHTRTVWLNFYPNGLFAYQDKEECRLDARAPGAKCIASCIEHTYEFTEGEGL